MRRDKVSVPAIALPIVSALLAVGLLAEASGKFAFLNREEKMTNSTLIARLMGPLLLVLGLGLLIGLFGDGGAKYMTMLGFFWADITLIIVFGMLTLVAGLAIVNAHNLWVTDWRVIITILGWLSVIGGVIRLLLPAQVQTLSTGMVANPNGMIIGGIITLVLGGILSWMGYEELCRHDKRRPAAAGRTTAKKRSAPKRRSASATRRKPRRRSR